MTVLITARQRSYGKVMFSQACVCSWWGCVCLVPGPFQGVGMSGSRFLLEDWVCLVHPLHWNVHLQEGTPNALEGTPNALEGTPHPLEGTPPALEGTHPLERYTPWKGTFPGRYIPWY